MAKQFSTLSFFLLCLLAFQEMMLSEAAICSAPSKLFRGLCFSNSNCSSICEKEGFLSGYCNGLRRMCICQKDCDGNGGGNDGGSDGGDEGQEPPDRAAAVTGEMQVRGHRSRATVSNPLL
ncbi:defensin J1-2-like [Salvia divinorum]|uniref:Defensin J1-2-like n=1 Tax=Salvia divinorum TaxID=28513 RepID=A0ABD1HJ68_SALDI